MTKETDDAIERLERWVAGKVDGYRKSDVTKALARITELEEDLRRWKRMAYMRLKELREQIRSGK